MLLCGTNVFYLAWKIQHFLNICFVDSSQVGNVSSGIAFKAPDCVILLAATVCRRNIPLIDLGLSGNNTFLFCSFSRLPARNKTCHGPAQHVNGAVLGRN